MRSGARLLQLLRPCALLFTAAILATVLASVLDGFTIALLIPFLRTLFGQQALGPAGGSAVQAVLARLTGALITAGAPQAALRNVVVILLVALVPAKAPPNTAPPL